MFFFGTKKLMGLSLSVIFLLPGMSLSEELYGEQRVEERAEQVMKRKNQSKDINAKCFSKATKKYSDIEDIKAFILECRSKQLREEAK